VSKPRSFAATTVVRCTYLFSPSPQSSPVVGSICGTHTLLLMLSVCELMFSWSSSLLPLPVMLLLLVWWGHFFHFSFVPNMFLRFPIVPGFNPICFAQSPSLLTYIVEPKVNAVQCSIESSTWGVFIVLTFSFVMGQ